MRIVGGFGGFSRRVRAWNEIVRFGLWIRTKNPESLTKNSQGSSPYGRMLFSCCLISIDIISEVEAFGECLLAECGLGQLV